VDVPKKMESRGGAGVNEAARKAVQVFFLLLFIVLLYMGHIQMWLAVFVTSAALAMVWGRFYCGWICPINTVTEAATGKIKKPGFRNIPMPALFKSPFFRYTILLIFIGMFVFIKVSGKAWPVLPVMFLIGVAVSLIFSEKIWHRYLCPFGTILSLTGGKSRRFLSIDVHRCSRCGICAGVCPGEAVLDAEEGYRVEKKECLQCGECIRNCPKEAISF